MKKIYVILMLAFVATVATSCVKPFEPTITLALNNTELTLPASTEKAYPTHFIQVTSNGSWEATLETYGENETWCAIEDYYVTTYTNEDGLAEEIHNPVANVTVIERFPNSDKGCKVQGTGTVYLPLHYNAAGSKRYAVFSVRRVDTGEVCVMRIVQQ